MSNGQGLPNPLAAPLSTLKQLGEQANLSIQSLGGGLAKTASQGLDALISGVPALPGVPGAAAGGGAFPTPASLMPANLQQALSNIENVIIPPGMTKPSSLLAGTPLAPAAPAPAAPTPTAPTAPAPSSAVTGRRQTVVMRGLR
jgi:hypothetical protein